MNFEFCGYDNDQLFEEMAKITMPPGFKLDFKEIHTFEIDGHVSNANFIESKIVSLIYNGAEIAVMLPEYRNAKGRKYLSINYIQGLRNREMPKEWFSYLLIPLIAAHYNLNPSLAIQFNYANSSRLKAIKEMILRIKKKMPYRKDLIITYEAQIKLFGSIRDRFFNKEGILDLKSSKKKRVLSIIKFYKQNKVHILKTPKILHNSFGKKITRKNVK